MLGYLSAAHNWLWDRRLNIHTIGEFRPQMRNGTAAPRNVRFCYVNPEHEQVFAASGWLTRYDLVRPVLHPRYSASFWRN